ncbi:MAG: M15 family metallopeptidase [Chlamydiae bacterium]|nr:M15 family metallopeptidase [Chlamydiota bacterium]
MREGDAVVRAFDARGWEWGARWTDRVDYQHFQKPAPKA